MDPPLSAEGRRQAERVGARLAGRAFAAHYASDLKRAFETAELVGAAVGVSPAPMPALREIFLGEWEGLRTEEIAERYPAAWATWVEEPDWDVVPGGEGAINFDARVGMAFDDILRRHDHGDVLVVTHGGVIQVALGRTLGRNSHGLFPLVIDNCSISILTRGRSRTVISGVNDICHLHAEALASTVARRERTGGLTQQY